MEIMVMVAVAIVFGFLGTAIVRKRQAQRNLIAEAEIRWESDEDMKKLVKEWEDTDQ